MNECGTSQGYGRHRARDEDPCPECRDARNRYHHAWRVQNGRVDSVQVRADVLAAVLAGDLDVLRMALGPEMVAALKVRADLEASRRRRDAETLAGVPEVAERLAPPPDSAFDAAWAAIHSDPNIRDSADTYIY